MIQRWLNFWSMFAISCVFSSSSQYTVLVLENIFYSFHICLYDYTFHEGKKEEGQLFCLSGDYG